MDDSKGETVKVPALGISISAQYATGRTVVFQTHVDLETSKDDLIRIVDKLNAIADRDEAFYAIEQAERQLEVETNATKNMARRLEEIETNISIKMTAEGKRNPKLSAQDEMQKKQARDTLEEGKKRVAIAQKFLDELKQKAGNRDGADSGPSN